MAGLGPMGMDPQAMARVVAHGKAIDAQMQAVRDRLARIADPNQENTVDVLRTWAMEGLAALDETEALMAVNPMDLMGGAQ